MPNQSPITIAPDFETRYPDSSARATECAMNLVFTADVLVKQVSRLLQQFELTPASGLVLNMLADSPSPLPPNEIADRLIITRATVTGLLDSLERRGYVRRTPHPSDRRMLLVEITQAGRETANQYRPVIHRQQKIWFGSLDENEQQQLISSLHSLQTSLINFG